MTSITIPDVPLSTNQLERIHWAAKKKMRSRLAWDLRFALLAIEYPVPRDLAEVRPSKMRVKIRAYRKRRLDPDNAYGGVKVILDAMRDVGILRNDSPKWLDLEVEQFIDGKNLRTEIDFEPIR
jgi:Holliday junction resolvase RusA-like endonuclease